MTGNWGRRPNKITRNREKRQGETLRERKMEVEMGGDPQQGDREVDIQSREWL